jgi:hypothetical protein
MTWRPALRLEPELSLRLGRQAGALRQTLRFMPRTPSDLDREIELLLTPRRSRRPLRAAAAFLPLALLVASAMVVDRAARSESEARADLPESRAAGPPRIDVAPEPVPEQEPDAVAAEPVRASRPVRAAPRRPAPAVTAAQPAAVVRSGSAAVEFGP